MKRTPFLFLLVTLLAAEIHGAPKGTGPQPIEPPAAAPSERRAFEFQGDDVASVLRTLARQVRMNLVIDDRLSGTVNIRLEERTPREVIDTIVGANEDWILDEKGGVFYVRLKNPPLTDPPAKKEKSIEEAIGEAYGPAFSSALMKLHEAFLDHQARPETARKIAKAKKALFDAFMAEGFTRDEAFRLVLADQGATLPNLDK
jgi:type II secretory pathway component GspD/PulD (secretin)